MIYGISQQHQLCMLTAGIFYCYDQATLTSFFKLHHLNLSDCLAFAQLSVACQCGLLHCAELDLTCVIVDNKYVSLSDTLFLQVLHAHMHTKLLPFVV